MARKAKELGALAIKQMVRPGLHFVGGVSGLALQVLPTGGRTWVLRATIGGKRRSMGLGGYPDVTVASARETARQAREQIRAGVDPIAAKKALRSALAVAQGKAMTFKECAEAYIAAHEAGWRNAKHRQQWTNSLTTWAYPKMGNLLVSDIEPSHVMAVLDPIWRSKTETAKRLRGRIECVLAWAIGRQLRNSNNPARWKGLLQTQLPAPGKVRKVIHYEAIGLNDIGGFMKRLRELEGTGPRALEFLILTAARSGEVRGANWDEIDIANRIWTIPAERMKAGKEHRVALSNDAIKLLNALPRATDCNFLFASPRGGQLSDMALIAIMRRMKLDAVPHGFRSTFRDWAAERTNYPRDAAEMALAHTIGDRVEAAYRRGDLFEKRIFMMTDWAAFCAKVESADVIPLQMTGTR